MIKELGKDVVFVTGGVRSAIYDFRSGKVYSINSEGTRLLAERLSHPGECGPESPFLEQVRTLCGLDGLRTEDYSFPQKEYRLSLAWLELTQRCNFRCVHCYEGNTHEEAQHPLSVDEWETVIDDLAANGCKQVQFIGGEPTIVPFLPHLLDRVHLAGVTEISLFTNLSGISRTLFNAIARNQAIVKFSLYGSSPHIHDAITQNPGSFVRLLKNVKSLQDAGIKLRANVILMRENEEDYANINALLQSLGITARHYDEIRNVYGGTQNRHMLEKPRLLRTSPDFKTSKKQFDNAAYFNTCWYGKLVISTDGTVFPCEFERDISYGSVRESSISELLSSEPLRKYWSLSSEQIEPCSQCEYRFACLDCRPLGYAERGCRTDKNPRCRYDPCSGEWGSD